MNSETTNHPVLSILPVPNISLGLPVAEAEALYLGSLESENTRRAYVRHLDQFFSLLSLKIIGEIEPGHLVAYRNYILGDGRGASSHSQAICTIRAFLLWAVNMNGSPLRADQIKGLLKTPNVKIVNPYQILTKAEILRVLAAAKKSGPRDYAMMLVFLGSGLRVAEVTALTCRDLRPDGDEGSYLHVRSGKGRKDRLVPVNEAIPEAVQAYLVANKRTLGTNDEPFLAYLRAIQAWDRVFPGFAHDTHGIESEEGVYKLLVLK